MNWIKSVAVGALLILSVLLSFTLVLAKENPPPGAPRDLVVTNVGKTNRSLNGHPPKIQMYTVIKYIRMVYICRTLSDLLPSTILLGLAQEPPIPSK